MFAEKCNIHKMQSSAVGEYFTFYKFLKIRTLNQFHHITHLNNCNIKLFSNNLKKIEKEMNRDKKHRCLPRKERVLVFCALFQPNCSRYNSENYLKRDGDVDLFLCRDFLPKILVTSYGPRLFFILYFYDREISLQS